MSALLDEETTTVDLTALDFEIPCIAGEHAAECLVSCRFCGEEGFHCWAHWQGKRRQVDELLALGVIRQVRCMTCLCTAASVDELCRVVSL